MPEAITARHPIAQYFLPTGQAKGPATILNFLLLRRDASVSRKTGLESTMVQHIREALNGNYARSSITRETKKALDEITTRFKHCLKIMPYRQLIEEGHVNQLLDDYLGLLVTAHTVNKDPRSEKYSDEREYYYRHPQAVKDVASHLKYFIIQ